MKLKCVADFDRFKKDYIYEGEVVVDHGDIFYIFYDYELESWGEPQEEIYFVPVSANDVLEGKSFI